MTEPQSRRPWISLGETIALGALIISALGLWISWKSTQEDKPTTIVEQKRSIPLVLRGSSERDGKALAITPVEPAHALDSLTISVAGKPAIEIGGDGRLAAEDVERLVEEKDRKGSGRLPVRIAARYVEMGSDRQASGKYVIRYRWEGGGLLGGRSLRLVGLSRG